MAHDDADVIDVVLDRAPCGYLAFSDDGIVRAVNATLLAMLRHTRDAVVGRHIEALLTVGGRIFYHTHLFPLLRLHGHAEEIFLLLSDAAGGEVAVLANVVRRERAGQWTSECILMQVRERRKYEDALLQARQAAERARAEAEAANALLEQQRAELLSLNEMLMAQAAELERQRLRADEASRAKSAFLTTVSHELRTPLNAISGWVQMLDMGVRGPVSAPQRDALGRIARSQRHLLRLINDLLNLGRIEAGHVEYAIAPLPLCEVVEAVLSMVEPQLHARALRYEIAVPADVVAVADRDKTEQILLNLLSNAAKFTPEGGTVRIAAGVASEGGERVFLEVRDTGVGIPFDRLQQVFDPFAQVSAAYAGRTEGTGLGLSISRDLARGMRGDLGVRSRVGVGSVFTLTLPRLVAAGVRR